MATNEEKVKNLGWLDENGICIFPDDGLAVTLGYKAPGLPYKFFHQVTPEQLQQAIDKGWIKFADGNADYYTFADYVKQYPDYPDPVFQLRLRGIWPPSPNRFIRIGKG